MESNPLVQLCQKVRDQLPNWLNETTLEVMCDGPMTPTQFVSYLVFEAVAQKERERESNETKAVYGYLQEALRNDGSCPYGSDSSNSSDFTVALKNALRDLGLRKDFMAAEIKRLNIPWDVEALKWRQKENARTGYQLTKIQFQQLIDRDDFCIKKVHELRRFINPKHAPNADVIRYYDDLTSHAERCYNETDPQKRAMSAINLNDFENRNLSFFLYHVAKYCVDHGIKEIDKEVEHNLLTISAAITFPNGSTSTHKPVLAMKDYIPAAIHRDSNEIQQYLNLNEIGLIIRQVQLPEMLDGIEYTYEDIDDFVCKWKFYDVFEIYSKIELHEDPQKNEIISLMRELVAKLTVDPLSI